MPLPPPAQSYFRILSTPPDEISYALFFVFVSVLFFCVLDNPTDGGCEHRPPPPKRKPPGTFDVMRSIVDSRGPAGLFTGALARVGKVAPACAIMMFSYEAGKRFFGQRNTEAAAAAAAARRQ